MRAAMLGGAAAARPQSAAPAAAVATVAPAPRPLVTRRRSLHVAAAAEAGSDAPAAAVHSFATTAPLRVRGMDGKPAEVSKGPLARRCLQTCAAFACAQQLPFRFPCAVGASSSA